MQRATRDQTFDLHSPANRPQITVRPGEVFWAETELCTGDWLQDIGDIWTPEKTNALNPTVVVAVEGAQPGDLLAVEILQILPDQIGYTGFNNDSNSLASLVRPMDWGHNLKTLAISEGFVHWSPTLKLPIRPMIGTLGTAPAREALSNAKGGSHGGNMDVQEVAAGATVYLPVETPLALLHIGDVHALQGDGEINCSGGIECRSEVQLRTRLLKRPEGLSCVRLENEEFLMTVACQRSMEESFYTACDELLRWMRQDFGIDPREGYLLMGQVLQARCTQFVNPTRSYICKMPKAILEQMRA